MFSDRGVGAPFSDGWIGRPAYAARAAGSPLSRIRRTRAGGAADSIATTARPTGFIVVHAPPMV